jgi:hypothetical protein
MSWVAGATSLVVMTRGYAAIDVETSTLGFVVEVALLLRASRQHVQQTGGDRP